MSKKTIENHTALSSARARVRKRVVEAGELRERFPNFRRFDAHREFRVRRDARPDELVPSSRRTLFDAAVAPCARAVRTTVARLPGTLFVTERHVCFESESTSGDSSDEGRKAPSRRLVLAHDEILGVTRSKTEGWIRVEVEVKTPEVEVRHSRGGEGEAGGERGERVSVRKSATFSGFGGDAETEGALALLEHPRLVGVVRSRSESFGVVRSRSTSRHASFVLYSLSHRTAYRSSSSLFGLAHSAAFSRKPLRGVGDVYGVQLRGEDEIVE